ncbi:MAG: hypothetical protein FJW37_11035 [Acidobacteria bacterium]|nr:hypothetical protein [Acidobacteriota bacterium]
MSRWCAALALAALAAAQQEPVPREEDESLTEAKRYSFNPLQAQKELQIGNFYFKKGSYRAAAQRFLEATKWDASLAEAWGRLGETEEKQRNLKSARAAYAKYLELAPEGKYAAQARKRMASLEKATKTL